MNNIKAPSFHLNIRSPGSTLCPRVPCLLDCELSGSKPCSALLHPAYLHPAPCIPAPCIPCSKSCSPNVLLIWTWTPLSWLSVIASFRAYLYLKFLPIEGICFPQLRQGRWSFSQLNDHCWVLKDKHVLIKNKCISWLEKHLNGLRRCFRKREQKEDQCGVRDGLEDSRTDPLVWVHKQLAVTVGVRGPAIFTTLSSAKTLFLHRSSPLPPCLCHFSRSSQAENSTNVLPFSAKAKKTKINFMWQKVTGETGGVCFLETLESLYLSLALEAAQFSG